MASRYSTPLLSSTQKQFRLKTTRASALGRYPRIKYAISALLLLSLFSFMHNEDGVRKFAVYYAASLFPQPPDEFRPPIYTELREWEKNLPQHNPDLPFPEGKDGRYVLFSNSRVNLLGWNNKLNDMLLNTWLAHASNRAYVFHDFAWAETHYPWPVSSYREWHPRTPLNALFAGPSSGAPWEPTDNAPRAVALSYFDEVCPEAERRKINTRDVKPALENADGRVIFETWSTLLSEASERCIEIVAPSQEEDAWPEVWDMWFWGSERSISLWDAFIASPVSRLLGTSPIVQSAIDDNLGLFIPSTPAPLLSSSLSPSNEHATSSTGSRRAIDPFAHVFAIHVRRGDFKEACVEHAQLNSSFYNWNLLPALPDRYTPPLPPDGIQPAPGAHTLENARAILERCLPSIDAIVRKVREAKEDYSRSLQHSRSGQKKKKKHEPELDVLYVMSNDRTEWLHALLDDLKEDGNWALIVVNRDLKMSPQQKDVGVAVDMDIGRRAAVFIGNGWSSFTSNVVHRRLADGKAPISIRFW
ncbi:unnamed protein product [Cyclocybe aegerita]|uniref:Uncharacterized protein n=1 Tax=Cyclocybe aegerita TaxID=1973307 RepID=A0A8S0X2X6_CYCAE|nr:unnamed protein product [Cyclocybe aegerita]